MRLSRLPEGATLADVRSRMHGYLGGEEASTEASDPAHADAVLYYRWNDVDGRFNSDVGRVYLRKGHVVATFFDPD